MITLLPKSAPHLFLQRICVCGVFLYFAEFRVLSRGLGVHCISSISLPVSTRAVFWLTYSVNGIYGS